MEVPKYSLLPDHPIALRTSMDDLQRHPAIRHGRCVRRHASFAAYQHALQDLAVPERSP
jgi:hypothetical protein